ncbi:MAG: alpha/beta fold hydrolase [SAR324 cluster bacterium]|nr:alpha/beta fold hydrolase [SAR324 cluster bacterium]
MTGSVDHAAGFETVTDAGPGRPWLTLVHGMSQHRRVFSAQVAAFRESYRLLLVDLPGHGLSSSLPGPYGLEEYARSVRAALAEAGVERTHYWGTHTGAGVGLLLACREPARFTALVLEGPVLPGRPPPTVADMQSQVGERARQHGLDAARRFWWERSEWFAVMRERPALCRAAEQQAIIADFQGGPWLDTRPPAPIAPLEDQLAQLQLPVLIVNGEHDVADFIKVAGELADLLPNAERAVIQDGGGFPLWEFPDRVNVEVRRFLA